MITGNTLINVCNLDIMNLFMNDIFPPGQSYSKMYETGLQYNEPGIYITKSRVITNTIQKNPKLEIYPNITNKCLKCDLRCMQITRCHDGNPSILLYFNLKDSLSSNSHRKCTIKPNAEWCNATLFLSIPTWLPPSSVSYSPNIKFCSGSLCYSRWRK